MDRLSAMQAFRVFPASKKSVFVAYLRVGTARQDESGLRTSSPTRGPCFETLASGASECADSLLSMRSLLWI